jgi:hypothetical protein
MSDNYVIRLDSMRITNTRALHEDTDYVCLAARVGGNLVSEPKV